METSHESCHACGGVGHPLMKYSLGKDFFGRPYDRLSPSSDQSPKWYCTSCSMHKNLQRDFRDIRTEYDKLNAGQGSELRNHDEFLRATVRLQEITAILKSAQGQSPLLMQQDVTLLFERFRTMTITV